MFVVYEFHSETNPNDDLIYEFVELHSFRTFEAADNFRHERAQDPSWVPPHWHDVYIEPIFNTRTGGSVGRRINVATED